MSTENWDFKVLFFKILLLPNWLVELFLSSLLLDSLLLVPRSLLWMMLWLICLLIFIVPISWSQFFEFIFWTYYWICSIIYPIMSCVHENILSLSSFICMIYDFYVIYDVWNITAFNFSIIYVTVIKKYWKEMRRPTTT